jgi:ApbE superfamily uncharacterized protein (UPF0280 family)
MNDNRYQDRFYRQWVKRDDLVRFQIQVGESDLLILCDRELREPARTSLLSVRGQIEQYIGAQGEFATSLKPLALLEGAPPVTCEMAEAAAAWNVGPMAAVAGAVAEFVGRSLLTASPTVMVENGGDVFVKASPPVRFALYAGEDSPFTDQIAFKVDAAGGLGVCTSSGLVGPSLSMGRADAVVAVAPGVAFADAAATAIANQIQGEDDVDRVVKEAEEQGVLAGIIACCGQRLGIWGDIELV